MSLLLQLPLSTGTVICVDKRHNYRGGHVDDHEKFLQLNQYWALVLTGTVGIDSPGQVALASQHPLGRVEGFLLGKRPAGGFAVADTVARFFRAFPPPSAGLASRFPRDYKGLEFECLLMPIQGSPSQLPSGGTRPGCLPELPEGEGAVRQRLESCGFSVLAVRQEDVMVDDKRTDAYQCTLRVAGQGAHERELRQQLDQAGFRAALVRASISRFANEDATFISDAYTSRDKFEEGFVLYYLSRLLDWIEEDYRNYLAQDKEEMASLASRSHWTGLPVLTASFYGRRRDATFFATHWLLEIRPGTSMPAWGRPIDLRKRVCAIGDVHALSALLGAEPRLARFLVEPQVTALQEICKGLSEWRGMLLADRAGEITLGPSEAASVLRRVCEITHECNRHGPTSGASDCFFYDYEEGISPL